MSVDTQASSFAEALDEVHTRFVLNLPDSELQTADRIFFQLEQAWWFYEDLICDPHPEWNLPRFPNLKPFCLQMFEYSPLLPDTKKFPSMWSAFSSYKRKISNYGCILLNEECSKFVLCRVWNGKSYTFPSGKINQGEDGKDAAARETYEETGFDPAAKFGVTAAWRRQDPSRITWKIELSDKDALVFTEDSGKRRTKYVVVGVPEDFPFEPVARKEVSDVCWHPIENFPKATFAVTPFVGPLRKWIRKHRRASGKGRSVSSDKRGSRSNTPRTTPNRRRNKSNNNTPSRKGSRGRVTQVGDDVVALGLAREGDQAGWSEEDMFLANEKLIGRPVEYDGNPHVFAEKGFAGNDPHAFRVVGGNFLNSIQSLAPPPHQSILQPLFLPPEKSQSNELTPFFSEHGVTPWGEVVEEARDNTPSHERDEKPASHKKKNRKPKANKIVTKEPADNSLLDELFLTDREITAKSQQTKTLTSTKREAWLKEIQDTDDYVRQWVEQLPHPKPTAVFGEFKLDIDAIMVEVNQALRLDQAAVH